MSDLPSEQYLEKVCFRMQRRYCQASTIFIELQLSFNKNLQKINKQVVQWKMSFNLIHQKWPKNLKTWLSKLSQFDSGLNIKVSSTFKKTVFHFKHLHCTIEEIKAFHLYVIFSWNFQGVNKTTYRMLWRYIRTALKCKF